MPPKSKHHIRCKCRGWFSFLALFSSGRSDLILAKMLRLAKLQLSLSQGCGGRSNISVEIVKEFMDFNDRVAAKLISLPMTK